MERPLGLNKAHKNCVNVNKALFLVWKSKLRSGNAYIFDSYLTGNDLISDNNRGFSNISSVLNFKS